MIKVPLGEAEGQVLGYDITVVDVQKGLKGVAFSRGHTICKEDLAVLERLGKQNIYVWEGSEEEIHEEEAALTVAPLIAGSNIRYDEVPKEGKIGFYATCPGLFEVDVERLERINRLAIPSLPTIHTHFPVQPDKLVAAFRIIPLTCQRKLLEKITAELDRPLLYIKPYVVKKVAILVTGSEVYHQRVRDGFTPKLTAKLAALGISVSTAEVLPDDKMMISRAIRAAVEGCELLLITGGTSVDPDDITTLAMREAGVVFPQKGNPVQPGNNLTIGYAGQSTVCAIPAAALHYAATAFDIYLPRLAAGQRILPEELALTGHGGLCHFCPVCHFPICPFGRN